MTGRNMTRDEERTGTGALQSIGRVFGELAHDLASELVVLQGWAQLARGEADAGRSSGAELDRVIELSDTIGAMLRDLLSVAEGQPISPEVGFHPSAVTEVTLAQRVRELSSLTVRLRVELPATAQVRGFASFWSRILTNLISNAARHASSEVVVVLYANDGDVVLRVEDDGPGVSPEISDRIFEPLWTAENGRIGLGLSSVTWLAGRLGGTARLVEPRELTGAAFEVRVRMASAIGSAGGGNDVRSTIRGRRILLIDDDSSVRRALRRLLDRIGAEVRELDPGHQPDEHVMHSLIMALPDVVLLDLRLGRGGGMTLWHSLLAQVPAAASRVVFMTGAAPGDPDWDEAEASGQPVLGKPFTLQQLAEAIGRLG